MACIQQLSVMQGKREKRREHDRGCCKMVGEEEGCSRIGALFRAFKLFHSTPSFDTSILSTPNPRLTIF